MLIRSGPEARGDAGTRGLSALADIASAWGYCFGMSCDGHAAPGCAAPALAEGPITTRRLACGPNVCCSELTTLRDNERVAMVKRSVMIAMNLEGSPITYAIDCGGRLLIPAGGAYVISPSDEVKMTAAYQCGERSRLLVIQYCPLDFADQELAGQLDAHLSETTLRPLLPSHRAKSLALELFSPSHTGLVGQLLAESCALELLARAIEGRAKVERPAAAAVHPKDVAKIRQLCEQLRTNLDAEHRLCDLARTVGMSVSTLKSKFAAVTGQPVFQFLRDQRLDRARTGLLDEGWTVSKAAYYVGYRHPTNFATAYRKRFGMAPTVSRNAA